MDPIESTPLWPAFPDGDEEGRMLRGRRGWQEDPLIDTTSTLPIEFVTVTPVTPLESEDTFQEMLTVDWLASLQQDPEPVVATTTTQACHPKRKRKQVVAATTTPPASKRSKPKPKPNQNKKTTTAVVVHALEQKIRKTLQKYRRKKTRASVKVFNERVNKNHTVGEDTKWYKTDIGCATHIRYAFLTPRDDVMFVCCKLGQDYMYHQHDQHGDHAEPLTFQTLLQQERSDLLEMFAKNTLSKTMYQQYHKDVQ